MDQIYMYVKNLSYIYILISEIIHHILRYNKLYWNKIFTKNLKLSYKASAGMCVNFSKSPKLILSWKYLLRQWQNMVAKLIDVLFVRSVFTTKWKKKQTVWLAKFILQLQTQFNMTSVTIEESKFPTFMPPGKYQIDVQMTKKLHNKYQNIFKTETFVTITWK